MNPILPPQLHVDERNNSSIVVDAGVKMELTGIKLGLLGRCVAKIKHVSSLEQKFGQTHPYAYLYHCLLPLFVFLFQFSFWFLCNPRTRARTSPHNLFPANQ